MPSEFVQKKPGLEEAAVTGMSVCEPKAGAIPSFVQGRSQILSVPQLPIMDSACWDGWSAGVALHLLSYLLLISFSSMKNTASVKLFFLLSARAGIWEFAGAG